MAPSGRVSLASPSFWLSSKPQRPCDNLNETSRQPSLQADFSLASFLPPTIYIQNYCLLGKRFWVLVCFFTRLFASLAFSVHFFPFIFVLYSPAAGILKARNVAEGDKLENGMQKTPRNPGIYQAHLERKHPRVMSCLLP